MTNRTVFTTYFEAQDAIEYHGYFLHYNGRCYSVTNHGGVTVGYLRQRLDNLFIFRVKE